MKKYATVETEKSHRIFTSALTWFLLRTVPSFEEREPGVHRQHHDRAEQDEQYVAACFQIFHDLSPLFIQTSAKFGYGMQSLFLDYK